MEIILSSSSSKPIYEQIVIQFKEMRAKTRRFFTFDAQVGKRSSRKHYYNPKSL